MTGQMPKGFHCSPFYILVGLLGINAFLDPSPFDPKCKVFHFACGPLFGSGLMIKIIYVFNLPLVFLIALECEGDRIDLLAIRQEWLEQTDMEDIVSSPCFWQLQHVCRIIDPLLNCERSNVLMKELAAWQR